MNENGNTPSLSDPATRSRFGFESEESWLQRCRAARQGPDLNTFGPYQLLADAGRGSQGTVYKALQPATGRTIALKRLGAGRFATPGMRARFELEIVALASLNHPGIVAVYGADEVDGQRIILMEWIDGASIDHWARPRSTREVLQCFTLACDAVTHAHRRGVIHRDLKPSNILVDTAGRPHVLDFGLARLVQDDRSSSMTSAFVGTPAYAAPEQLTGRPQDIDTRADVYALGVVLYELLTRSRPVEPGPDLGAMIDAIRHHDPRKPSRLNPDLDSELDAITLKAINKDLSQRYQSVSDLQDDVRRYLSEEPVLAHPPDRWYRFTKFARRHRAAVAATFTIAIVLLAGAAATAVQAVRARRAEVQMSIERDTARTEARRADAVRDFLTSMLSDASPHRGGSRELTVRQALDRATARLDAGSLKDQPEVEEAVRWSIGMAYMPIGDRRAAATQFEWCVRFRERAFGPLSSQVGDALYWYGEELTACGAFDEAVVNLRRGLDAYRHSGPGRLNRYHLLMTLANIERKRGDKEQALAMYQELVAHFRDTESAQWELAWTMFGVAQSFRDLGRTQECIAAFEAARPFINHAVKLGTRSRMWFDQAYCQSVLEPAARHEDIIALCRPLLAASIEPFGEQDNDVGQIMVLLAEALIATDHSAEAEPLLRRYLAVREGALKNDDHRLLNVRSLLGAAAAQLDRPEEAERLLVSSFEVLDVSNPPRPTERNRALARLLEFYQCQGRPDQVLVYRARTAGH